MTSLDKIAGRIVKEQELIIGPLAWSEAQKVSGIRVVDRGAAEVAIENGDPKDVVNRLVAQYARLFGEASRQSCREAVSGLLADLSPSEIPSSLMAT